MSEPLEVPQPPRPKRLNRLALVAVLVLLGVAVAAVFLTLAPPKRGKAAVESPEAGGVPRPSFLDREPPGAEPGRRPAPAESPSYWQEALREGRTQTGPGPAGESPLELGREAEGGPPPGMPGAQLAKTPAPSPREEAYRRALQAPVAPPHAAAAEGGGDGFGEGGAGERLARQQGLPAALPFGVPPGALPPAAAFGGQAPDAAAAPPAAGAAASGRDHQGFLRSTEALQPTALKVRRDGPGAGLVLEAGTVLPAALVTAVDSDIAGPLVAQVTQDVFDRTQRRVVIPRGSRLLGSYDSQVALGERRLLVAWGRVIFPDGSGLSFPGLPAATKSGEAGLAGSVNNHLARVFGGAILLSIVSAGAQLSQPQESATFGSAASTRQVAAAAVGQELSSVAIEMLRRQMAVPPTIRIPSGTSFYVFLRGDVSFTEPAAE
jgi:type IV secretory pathway VirB10-like protein